MLDDLLGGLIGGLFGDALGTRLARKRAGRLEANAGTGVCLRVARGSVPGLRSSWRQGVATPSPGSLEFTSYVGGVLYLRRKPVMIPVTGVDLASRRTPAGLEHLLIRDRMWELRAACSPRRTRRRGPFAGRASSPSATCGSRRSTFRSGSSRPGAPPVLITWTGIRPWRCWPRSPTAPEPAWPCYGGMTLVGWVPWLFDTLIPTPSQEQEIFDVYVRQNRAA